MPRAASMRGSFWLNAFLLIAVLQRPGMNSEQIQQLQLLYRELHLTREEPPKSRSLSGRMEAHGHGQSVNHKRADRGQCRSFGLFSRSFFAIALQEVGLCGVPEPLGIPVWAASLFPELISQRSNSIVIDIHSKSPKVLGRSADGQGAPSRGRRGDPSSAVLSYQPLSLCALTFGSRDVPPHHRFRPIWLAARPKDGQLRQGAEPGLYKHIAQQCPCFPFSASYSRSSPWRF